MYFTQLRNPSIMPHAQRCCSSRARSGGLRSPSPRQRKTVSQTQLRAWVGLASVVSVEIAQVGLPCAHLFDHKNSMPAKQSVCNCLPRKDAACNVESRGAIFVASSPPAKR